MSLRIVVLDGKYANPGDLSWDQLIKHGDLKVYEQTSIDQVIDRSKEADILIINKVKLGDEQFHQLPNLKLIIISATGMDNVDLNAAHARKIQVKNVSGYSTISVAQHTFSLLLELTNQVARHSQSVKDGEWDQDKGFCYTLKPIPELSELTLAVIGYGQIGRAVAKLGKAFGMDIMVVSEHSQSLSEYELVSLEDAFQSADVISLHWPLTNERKGIINKDLLTLMKPGSFLINTARGGLINETDLHQALKSYKIGGAALDVLSEEPPATFTALMQLDNCIFTPHMAWASHKSRKILLESVFQYVEEFVQN